MSISSESAVKYLDDTNNRVNSVNRVLKEVNRRVNIHTSTPNTINSKKMDLSFLKCHENVGGVPIQHVDTDSGYLSNPLDATVEKDATMFINKSPPFLSEDALLEKPVSVKKSEPNQDVYQQNLNYFSAINVSAASEGSIVPETDEELSPIIEINKMPMVVEFALEDANSNTSNKENCDFNQQSLEKMLKVKVTPRKGGKKRRLSSASSASGTPKKQHINNTCPESPDLFDDSGLQTSSECNETENVVATEQYIKKIDKLLVKSINSCMSGVLPPPSVTTTQITVNQMLEKLKADENQIYFWSKDAIQDESDKSKPSLIINTDMERLQNSCWPIILNDRYHGLNYNHSKYAEDTEALFMKYSQRYIGAETQSSCTIFDTRLSTPAKRKANRLRWVNNSPGRRLSHLARRRITFSSANIQAGSSAHSRQIMVDAKRFELLSRRVSPRKSKSPRKTPRKSKTPRKTPRKTPGKSPRRVGRTPNSSTKKRMAFKVLADVNLEPSTSARASATKRALFQSPDKNVAATRVSKVLPSTSNSSLSPWKKRSTPKRALFMSPSKSSQGNKRKRIEVGENETSCKFARSLLNPSENPATTSALASNSIIKPRSESLLHAQVVELSEHHKKKLQWAVYEALRIVNIRIDHEKFKQYASVLARVTRRILPTVASSAAGTSERMLRITKQHVYSVIKGMTMEEIIRNYESSRLKLQKPSGYIRKEDVSVDVSSARSNALRDCANVVHSTEKKNTVPEKKIDSKVDRVKKIIKF